MHCGYVIVCVRMYVYVGNGVNNNMCKTACDPTQPKDVRGAPLYVCCVVLCCVFLPMCFP